MNKKEKTQVNKTEFNEERGNDNKIPTVNVFLTTTNPFLSYYLQLGRRGNE